MALLTLVGCDQNLLKINISGGKINDTELH